MQEAVPNSKTEIFVIYVQRAVTVLTNTLRTSFHFK
jgi:hypothetical protein